MERKDEEIEGGSASRDDLVLIILPWTATQAKTGTSHDQGPCVLAVDWKAGIKRAGDETTRVHILALARGPAVGRLDKQAHFLSFGNP
ncbi:unnamed protein product [Clonostachys chloroleuca]|uniref:Uncharacterized protein n=1 Tax=Clonostachys chloroleuca TaxID=1926264 RepID=A0AA35QCT1_9HYPO|nr:unnamed protein product [Clonostachys chloroleuca]